jgi:hypothetical protein
LLQKWVIDMTNTTERLVSAINKKHRKTYPNIGYLMFADVCGNGSNRKQLYVIANDKGGVTYSDLNGSTPRERCYKLRKEYYGVTLGDPHLYFKGVDADCVARCGAGKMFLSIYHNQSGEEYIRRVLPGEELDLRAMVRNWAENEHEGEVIPSFSEIGSHIPNGCGEYQAELRGAKKSNGFSCFTSEPFYMVAE